MMNPNAYRNALRDYIELLQARAMTNQMIRWEVMADEQKDPTLLSLRAYGSREHADVVMVACGVNGIFEPLPLIDIVLPKLTAIRQLRRQYGMG